MKMDPSPELTSALTGAIYRSQIEPVQQCDAGASGTPNCCLTRARTPDSLRKRLLLATMGARHTSEGRQMWKGSSSDAPYARRAQELGHRVREDPRGERGSSSGD